MTSVQISQLGFEYNKNNRIFDGVNILLSNERKDSSLGVIYTLLGNSGCGKSTFLKLLANIEEPNSGSIKIFPHDALVTYLPQEPILFEHLSREDNAIYYSKVNKLKKHFDQEIFNKLKKKLKLDKVIESSLDVWQMSGGERQRLVLLRALSIKPKILLLDEPCTGLDVTVKISFLRQLRQITDDLNLLVIYVTHHIQEAKLISDKIIYMNTNIVNSAQLISKTMSEFLEIPPSLEAALLAHGFDLNYFCYSIENTKVLDKNNNILGNINTVEQLNHKQGILCFFNNMLSFNDNGIPVTLVAKSNEYLFLRIDKSDVELIIKDPNIGHDITSVSIAGLVTLFDINGKNPQKIRLKLS